MARVATLEERHRSATAVLERIDSLFREMSERLQALASQIEGAAAEKLQREAENLQLEQHVADFEAERNAGQAREGLLQFETDQLRARLSEIDELLQERAPTARSGARPARRIAGGRGQAAIRWHVHGGNLPE